MNLAHRITPWGLACVFTCFASKALAEDTLRLKSEPPLIVEADPASPLHLFVVPLFSSGGADANYLQPLKLTDSGYALFRNRLMTSLTDTGLEADLPVAAGYRWKDGVFSPLNRRSGGAFFLIWDDWIYFDHEDGWIHVRDINENGDVVGVLGTPSGYFGQQYPDRFYNPVQWPKYTTQPTVLPVTGIKQTSTPISYLEHWGPDVPRHGPWITDDGAVYVSYLPDHRVNSGSVPPLHPYASLRTGLPPRAAVATPNETLLAISPDGQTTAKSSADYRYSFSSVLVNGTSATVPLSLRADNWLWGGYSHFTSIDDSGRYVSNGGWAKAGFASAIPLKGTTISTPLAFNSRGDLLATSTTGLPEIWTWYPVKPALGEPGEGVYQKRETNLHLFPGWSLENITPTLTRDYATLGTLRSTTGSEPRPTTPAILVPAGLWVDLNRDGEITPGFEKDYTTSAKPFLFWSNDDHDNRSPTAEADYVNTVVDGPDDLADFFPVFLDLKQLITVLPPSALVKYKLKQADGGLNFVYTSLTRATAFDYQNAATATTGYGPNQNAAAREAPTHQITATGIDIFELDPDLVTRIKDQNQGVILLEGRQATGEPLTLVVEKDSVQIAEVKLELCMLRVGKLWETSNKTNQIPNKTRKDDATAPERMEIEGDDSYAVPRNNLYVVAAATDNKVKVSLDIEIPAKFRPKFYAAAWDGQTKVAGSDAAFPATAGQPALLQIPAATTAETKEYQIRVGYDGNSNGILEAGEASPVPIYKRRDTHELRYAVVKGVSNARYEESDEKILDAIHLRKIAGIPYPFPEDRPNLVAKHARSFLALFYYNGDFDSIAVGVQPSSTGAQQLDAFAEASGFAEWLTHNSGGEFTDATGVASIDDYQWIVSSEVAGFLAQRTPFALETAISNAQGYFESPTDTGAALKAFYIAQVKAQAEHALQASPVGATVTLPLDGGWYEFPQSGSPNLFKSTSPGNWVTPSTQLVGADDGAGGYGALLGDLLAGTDEFNNFDAFGTIGRGRVLTPRYQITVKKEDTGIISPNIEYKVSEVLFECAVEDLYDFNYEDVGRTDLAQRAATVQIGWGNGANGSTRDKGKIYRHHINIRHSYAYPFEQTMFVNP